MKWMQTTPDALAQQIDAERGTRTRQEFVNDVLRLHFAGDAVANELRAEIERLHVTLRAFAGGAAAGHAAASATPTPPTDERLGWD